MLGRRRDITRYRRSRRQYPPFTIPAGASAGILNVATAALVLPEVTTPLKVKATSGGTTLTATLNAKFVGPKGGLDTKFGNNGTAQIINPTGAIYGPTYSAVQPDGKIVTAAAVNTVTKNYDWVVLRTNANGTPDTTFGTDGRVVIIPSPSPSNAVDFPHAIAVLADGKIIVGGRADNAIVLARLTRAGKLDTTCRTAKSLQAVAHS